MAAACDNEPTDDPATHRHEAPHHSPMKQSAGTLLYRRAAEGGVEVLLVHPSGGSANSIVRASLRQRFM